MPTLKQRIDYGNSVWKRIEEDAFKPPKYWYFPGTLKFTIEKCSCGNVPVIEIHSNGYSVTCLNCGKRSSRYTSPDPAKRDWNTMQV